MFAVIFQFPITGSLDSCSSKLAIPVSRKNPALIIKGLPNRLQHGNIAVVTVLQTLKRNLGLKLIHLTDVYIK